MEEEEEEEEEELKNPQSSTLQKIATLWPFTDYLTSHLNQDMLEKQWQTYKQRSQWTPAHGCTNVD